MAGRQDIKEVGMKFNDLLRSCKPYVSEQDMQAIDSAFRLVYDTEVKNNPEHVSENVSHALEVAKIATDETGLGAKSVIAAILHHAFNEDYLKPGFIEKNYDSTILGLLKGYTKISNLPTDRLPLQSVKFRQLFLTLIDDIRIILLKIAHRLYDMRNIENLPDDKQGRFSNEVVHLYIPIAHRLGLYRVKSEMEDLYMHYAHKEIYNSIKERLKETAVKRNVFIQEFTRPIERELHKQGFSFDIKGRPKSIPSIWEKMKKQDVELDEVFDLFAIRIIVDSKTDNEKSDCWKIYSIVTNLYPPNPKRLRDWITTPKASGYESLHTTVRAPNNKWVEVQIRTRRMDSTAEKGQAAHWRYKGFGSKQDTESWLNQVRDILENPEQIKFDEPAVTPKTTDKIFIFTPNGDLKELRPGATVLDFAYEVHTNVGDTCIGASVNNKRVPIRHVLSNGDTVKIVTSKNQRPRQDWLKYVITSKAKNKIKRSLKEQKFREAEIGIDILKRKFRYWKLQFNDEYIDKLVKYYKLNSSIDLYGLIAIEKIELNEVRDILTGRKKEQNQETTAQEIKKEPQEEPREKKETERDVLVIDKQLDKVNYTLAKCCNPIPGDNVFGFVTIGRGITIHRRNCPNAKRLLEKYGYRRINVKWKTDDNGGFFQTSIKITGEDRVGMLQEITNIISSDFKFNMQSIQVDSNDGVFTGIIRVQVRNNQHLDELIYKILKIKGITKVNRLSRRD